MNSKSDADEDYQPLKVCLVLPFTAHMFFFVWLATVVAVKYIAIFAR